MTSNVILYYECLVEQDKHFILNYINGQNAIELHLNTLKQITINKFQYVKQSLSLTIKIELPQSVLEMGEHSTDDINYVKIQNGNETPCYYFVISKNWKSSNTIEFILSMDTINTYQYGRDFIVNKKTLVKRSHMDRFENIDPTTQDNFLTRKIWLKSEEINPPVYKIKESNLIEKNGESLIDWALYYKNSDNQESSPIDCFLVPNDALNIKYQGNPGEFTNQNVPLNKILLFFVDYNYPNISFDIDGAIYSPSYSFYAGIQRINAIAIQNDSGTLKVYNGSFYKQDGPLYNGLWTLIADHPTSINVINSPADVYSMEVDSLPTGTEITINQYWDPVNATHQTSMGALIQAVLYGKNSIDKTLENNIKIINIPYSPTSFNVDNSGIYTFEDCWRFNISDGVLKLIDFNKKFINHVVTNTLDFYDDFFYKIDDYSKLNGKQKRFIKDSKLFHSDFYRPKFVYDSFSKIFPMEQLIAQYGLRTGKFKFDFVMSRNIVSKFLFKFDYQYKNAVEDYENIVAVSRNNEEVLYNSQYLNYIRNGYNYDLKSKERTEVASGIGLGLNIASLLASIGISFIPGAQAIGIGGAVASSISLAGQIVNFAKTTAQNEENIQKKIEESKMQSISVLNADDYDLLYEYTNNKAKLCTYSVSTDMEKILDDLFYYGGYIINEQRLPNISSRYWFNYLEADLVIDKTNNLTNEIIEDIKEKFSQGVTFLHYQFNKFDFEQEMENIETFLYRDEE